jgi:UDP-glucose 4-epimerase
VSVVLVTGGAGFIGSHLVEALLDRGHEVRVIDNESTGRRDNLNAVLDHPRLTYVRGDVVDHEAVAPLLEAVDEVYHLAAAVGVRLIANDPIHTIENNILPCGRILEALGAQNAADRTPKFLLASTSEVYGKNPNARWREDDDLVLGPTSKPRWAYGASKAIDEFLTLAYGRRSRLSVVVARFFNVVGPRQVGNYGMVLPSFVEAALQGMPLTVHDDGGQTRCFCHVRDVVEGIIQLMASEQADGQVVNLGSDHPISILALARRVVELTESRSPIIFQGYAEAYSGDFEDVRARVPDLTKVQRLIGFQPSRSLDDMIRDVIEDRRQMLGIHS